MGSQESSPAPRFESISLLYGPALTGWQSLGQLVAHAGHLQVYASFVPEPQLTSALPILLGGMSKPLPHSWSEPSARLHGEVWTLPLTWQSSPITPHLLPLSPPLDLDPYSILLDRLASPLCATVERGTENGWPLTPHTTLSAQSHMFPLPSAAWLHSTNLKQ